MTAQISMTPSAWTLNPKYNVGVPLHPTPASVGWSIGIPAAPGHLNMCLFELNSSIRRCKAIEITGALMRGPGVTFKATEPGGLQPCIVPYFETRGVNYALTRGRYWARDFKVYLAAVANIGPFKITAPIAPEGWVAVHGEATERPARFYRTATDCGRIGMTFGGGGGLGHGVSAEGASAVLTITSYRLI